MELKFKIATINDVKGIIELCNDCFGDGTDINEATKMLEKTINDPNIIHIIGEIDDKIVAHTRIQIVETMFKKMDTYAILNHVCVNGKYRRHNIATKMLNVITKVCKERNCTSIKLWSMNFREAAHACYKKNNFIVNDAKFFSKDI